MAFRCFKDFMINFQKKKDVFAGILNFRSAPRRVYGLSTQFVSISAADDSEVSNVLY